MKTRLIVPVLLLCSALWLAGDKVVESELGKGRAVRFVNYAGRYTRIMPRAEIRGIGEALAAGAGRENRLQQGPQRVSLIMARGAGARYNADIVLIGAGADIVNIEAIRLVIAAYLEKKYGYAAADASLLARFVTYYNAAYRGQIGYLGSAYNPEVMRHLTARTAGLSRFYYQWPGSRILIPLRRETGSTNIHTGEISGRKITGDLKDKDGIDDRKRLLDIKEREAREKKAQLDRLKREAEERERQQQLKRRQLQDEQDRLKKAQANVKKQEDDLQKKKDQLLTEKDPKKQQDLQGDVNKGEKDLKDARKDRDKQQDDVGKKQQDVDSGDKQLKKQQQEIKKREDDVKKRDADIDRDKKTLQQDGGDPGKDKRPDQDDKKDQPRKDRQIFEGTLYYMKIQEVLSGGHYNNIMYLIDPLNNTILKQSPFMEICGRKFDIFTDGVVVIGHKGGHANQHFLVLLDHKELKPGLVGTDDIYFRSFVEIRKGFIYAVYKEGAEYRLGRFSPGLVKEAGSDIAVDPDSFISFYEGFLYINSPDKQILVLDSMTLKKSGGIAP